MAKAQVAARFVTEVAPPQLVSIMRRRHKAPRSGGLDTIAEDDRELQLAYGDHHAAASTAAAGPSARAFTAASLKSASPTTTTGFMRELSSCFSGNVVHAQAGGGRGWEGRHKGHARQAVYAHRNQTHGKLKN